MNPYRKHTEVYLDLVKLIEANLDAGKYFLPTETELARQFATSRMTLRKALEMASMNGLITRENKRTTINANRNAGVRKCGRILFIARANGQTFFHPAVERLWLHLVPEIRMNGGSLDLLLVDNDLSVSAYDDAVAKADIVFLTTPTYTEWSEDRLDRLLTQTEKAVWGLFDPLFARCSWGVTLDNLEAGRLAAEALYQAGSRKAIVISDTLRQPHSDRIKGFRSEFESLGGETCLAGKREGVQNPAYYLACRPRIRQAFKKGCDGVFLASDEGIDIILMDLFAKNLIPGRFKVVSVNGCGQALRHNPPISCVNHATEDVVKEIMTRLGQWGQQTGHPPFHVRIKPKLYRTGTI